MRALGRIALVALALAAAAAVAIALWLPRYVASPDFAARLRAAAREASGREVEWRALSVGLVPLRLVATGARIAGSEAGAPALEAERVDLRLALLPLFARAVVVDSLALDGAVLHIVRTKAGVDWGAPLPSSGGGSGEAGAGSGPSLALRNLRVAGSRIAFEDRAVAPPASLELLDVAATLRAAAAGPLAVDLSGRLAGGGELRAEGSLSPGGAGDLTMTLRGVSLAQIAPWLGKDVQLAAGSADGTLRAGGPLRGPDQLEADLQLADADLRVAQVGLRGPVAARASLAAAAGGAAGYGGHFEIDATRAELVYGGAFRKPPGASATADGKLVTQPDGKLGVDAVKISIKNMDGQGRLGPGGPSLALADPASLDADLAGLAADPARPLAGARGSAAFAAGRGRIPGVSPLERVLASLRGAGDLARSLLDSESLRPLLGDEFESLRGSFELGEGRARTQDLVVAYPGYALGLRGSIGLLDERLDLAGSLTLGQQLGEALAPESPLGGRTYALARIGGTVSDPTVEIEPEAAAALAAGIALGRRGKLERKIDKHLGGGTGRQILNALDGLLRQPGGKEHR